MCEDDPDKAECIREVEEAKATPEINDVHQEGKVRALVLKLIGSIFCECRCEISRKQAKRAVVCSGPHVIEQDNDLVNKLKSLTCLSVLLIEQESTEQ